MENGKTEIDVEKQFEHSSLLALRSHPWLVYSHGVGKQVQTFFSISESHEYVRRIPDMTNKIICTCAHGWLVLLDADNSDCFLLNPVSMEKIQLPPVEFSFCICVLSSAPDNPNGCFIVFIDYKYLMFCQPGDDIWNIEELEYEIMCAIGYEGNIYAIKYEEMNNVDLLEVNPGFGMRILREGLLMPSPSKHILSSLIYMVESCGDIFVIEELQCQYYKSRIQNFEIYKVNLSTLAWEKVENLGDRAFFIDTINIYCFSCLATESGIKKNSIYFTGTYDKGLYIFDLELKNISISFPCPDVDSDNFEVAWIMSAPTMSCSPNSNEGRVYRNKYDEENTVAIVKDMIPTIKNTVEEVMEVQQVSWSWVDLPQELLSLIQSHLFHGDRSCFRAVCRAWQCSEVPLPPDWLDYLMMVSSPCLMSFSTEGNINMFYPMYNNRYTLKLEEELFGALICFSNDGWLLLFQGLRSMFFFHPFTETRIELPDFPHNDGFDAFCFTSTPMSSDCIVFGIWSFWMYEVTIFIIHVGEERWNVYNFENKERWRIFNCINRLVPFFSLSFSTSQRNPVFFGGLFYCLDEEGKLGYFDPEGGSWTVFRTSWRLNVWEYDQNFLVECDGNLLAVFVGPVGGWIQVCRLDQSKMIWENVKSLGNWMLFLSEKTCFSVKAAVRGMGNKIYFQRFYANHGVFYSLTTKRYHTFDGGCCLTNFYGTTEEIQCTWML
ncbi:hypothetical protein NE237_008051 [Protea cynaroides]|uniref:KIB1-4 beta-propeller domain-containing protein n=1 Tax=Protea cynaroides TaxID=273540 RepID=A0A9Q0QWZ9_9MAGN|nr:hypothetical protein NE237_008051 [Protea cynaroides]